MLRRLILAAFLLLGAAALTQASEVVDVHRAEGCDCCGKWAEYPQKKGFQVRVHNLSPSRLDRIKAEAGVPGKYASCHTGKVQGYAVEVMCRSRTSSGF